MSSNQVKIGVVTGNHQCIEALLNLYRLPYELLQKWTTTQLTGYEVIIIPPRTKLSEASFHSLRQVNEETGVGLIKIGEPRYSEESKSLKSSLTLFGVTPRLGIPKLEREGREIHFVRDHQIIPKEFITELSYSNLQVSMVSRKRGQILGYILDEIQDEWPAVLVSQHGPGKRVWINHGIGGTGYPGGKIGILFRELLRASVSWVSKSGILPRLNLWPKDYCCAFLLTIDLEDDKDYRAGRVGQSHVRTHTTKLLDILAKRKIRGTWNTCGKIAEQYPDLLKHIKQQNHELAGHTYSHEYLPFLTYDQEKAILERMINSISNVIEEPITGFRAPRMYLSENTPSLLNELGFQWDSSARSTYDLPYPLKDHKELSEVLELPETGPMDWKLFSFLGYSSEEGADALKEEFTKNYERGAMFLHILHPWQIAAQDYLTALDMFLSHVTSFADVWMCSCGELAGWWGIRQRITLNWHFMNENECQISISNNSDQRIENLGVLLDKSDTIKKDKLQIRSENPIDWRIISKQDYSTICIILSELKPFETTKIVIHVSEHF